MRYFSTVDEISQDVVEEKVEDEHAHKPQEAVEEVNQLADQRLQGCEDGIKYILQDRDS